MRVMPLLFSAWERLRFCRASAQDKVQRRTDYSAPIHLNHDGLLALWPVANIAYRGASEFAEAGEIGTGIFRQVVP